MAKKPAPRKTKPTKSVSMKDQEQQVMDIPGATLEEQPGPITVVNGRILAEYVKPVFTCDKNDDRFVALEFAVKLTEAHKTILPHKVLDAWRFVDGGGGEGVKDIAIAPQTVRIFLTSDSPSEELIIVGGVIEHAKVDIVEERGKGEAVKFTRYSFRVSNERTKNLINFACWKDGQGVWLECKPTQTSLIKMME